MLNLFVDVLLPPASLAVLALVLLFAGRRGRVGAITVLVILVLLSMPIVAVSLLNSLAPPPAAATSDSPPSAVVILSADAIRLPDPAQLDPGLLTLDRIRAGARVAARSGLPILVSGGPIPMTQETLAGMMATSLRDDFHQAPKWIEDRSLDTWENAQFSSAILKAAGIQRIYLVTHSWHMRRALIAFRHFGMDPVSAPVRPAFIPPFSWRGLIPNPSAWYDSYIALHEWVGLAYYALRS